MTKVDVRVEPRHYEVHLCRDTAEEVALRLAAELAPSTGVAILVDGGLASLSSGIQPLTEQIVLALKRALPNVKRRVLPAGEKCKTLAEVERTCEWLSESGYDRGAALVGIGGGATSDHAGFAASVYLRGIPFALLPTTLLAMADASVGGKTGVDLAIGKNLVGAFYQPRAVEGHLGFLESLPEREFRAGLAEIAKCGFIADAELLRQMYICGPEVQNGTLERIIATAVAIKAAVVAEDEREAGRRAVLNFGHTIGHAIEWASGYRLLHGEAVSLGMVAALRIGETLGLTSRAVLTQGVDVLRRLGLPIEIEHWMTPEVVQRTWVDKKRHGQDLRFVLVTEPGQALIHAMRFEDWIRVAEEISLRR